MGLKVVTSSDADIKPKMSEIRAVVTRADGRVEDLGRIAYWHRNPLRNFAGNAMIKVRELLRRIRS